MPPRGHDRTHRHIRPVLTFRSFRPTHRPTIQCARTCAMVLDASLAGALLRRMVPSELLAHKKQELHARQHLPDQQEPPQRRTQMGTWNHRVHQGRTHHSDRRLRHALLPPQPDTFDEEIQMQADIFVTQA